MACRFVTNCSLSAILMVVVSYSPFIYLCISKLPYTLLLVLFKLTHPHTDARMLTVYFISPALVIFSGLYLYYLLKKYLPGFTAWITGGK